MEIYNRLNRGSFTVEATFVVTISIWVVLMVCYLALYAHDETAMYSLGHNYLEMAFENGASPSEAEAANELQQYLQKHMLIGRIYEVSVEKKWFSMEAVFRYETTISVPFIRKLLTGEKGVTMIVSRENFRPAERMWDREILDE